MGSGGCELKSEAERNLHRSESRSERRREDHTGRKFNSRK
jgi:hypothetical protein